MHGLNRPPLFDQPVGLDQGSSFFEKPRQRGDDIDGVRRETKGVSIAIKCLSHFPLQAKCVTHIAEYDAISGLQGKGSSEKSHSPLEFPHINQNCTKVAQSLRKVRFQCHGQLKGENRFSQTTGLMKSTSHQIARVGKFRVQIDSLAISANRLVKTALTMQDDAQNMMTKGDFGTQENSAPGTNLCLAELSKTLLYQSELHPCLSIRRTQLANTFEQSKSLL